MIDRSILAGHALPEREWFAVPVGIAIAAGILQYSPYGWELTAMFAITAFCICLWIAAPVPTWYTSLVGIALIGMALSLDLALRGFQSPAVWLVVLGLLMGEAITESGLAARAEVGLLRRLPERVLERPAAAYRVLLIGLCALGAAFAVVIPSALVRVLMLGPIVQLVGDSFSSRNAKVGLFLGPLFATYFAGTGILTGSLVNILITGVVDAQVGEPITWTQWGTLMFPVMSVARVALIVVVTSLLYRPAPDEQVDLTRDTVAPTTDGSRRMLLYLAVGVAVWVTDGIHGLHPLFGALSVVVLSFTPKIGVVSFERVSAVNFSIVFFLGAILAIAEGLIHAEFGSHVTSFILAWIPADTTMLGAFLVVLGITIPLTLLMSGLTSASVLTPVFVSFAQSLGIPITPVMLVEAMALSVYFFPYQSTVLIAILSMGVVDLRELVVASSVISISTILVVFPLQLGLLFLVF
ncbi:SLC13 family permease [Halobellus sp. GM3]|uniref:SLC13 family permease n=1 Tax=Halobellus sp. GM3 TaxID=3458410 RepID=UPI00403D5C46